MIRFAHIADLHLDPEHPEALEILNHVIDVAQQRACDLLLLAGDIWDRRVVLDRTSPVNAALEYIELATSRMPVYILKGNHDREGSLTAFARVGAHVIEEHPVTALLFTHAGNPIRISAIPYPSKSALMRWLPEGTDQDTSDAIANNALRQIIRGFAATHSETPDVPHILMYHGNVTGCRVESGQIMLGGDVMISAADLEESGADYIALGHIHGYQVLGTKCVYSGSIYHTDFGEVEPKYMVVGEISDEGATWEAVRLPSRPKVNVEALVLLTDEGHHDITITDMDALIASDDADVKIKYRIAESDVSGFNEQALASFVPDAYSVRYERIVLPRERVRAENIVEARTLREKLISYATVIDAELPEGVLAKADSIEVEGGVA